MNQKVLLIISLLSSALSDAALYGQKFVNPKDSLRVPKRELPLAQLFPSLRLNQHQNGSIFIQEINSAINYANSTIQKVIEETRNLFNLTGGQYNADEIAVIMAFPMSKISLKSNESSIILNNSSSKGNSRYGLKKDGLNFSGRFLDLNKLLSFVPSPLNLLGRKFSTPTTTPATYAESTYKVYEESYPTVPVVPVVPVEAPVSYEVPEAPQVAYEEPNAPQYASVAVQYN
jgi:hypothetical protein